MSGGIAMERASALIRKDPETLGISSRAISDFIDAVHESNSSSTASCCCVTAQ